MFLFKLFKESILIKNIFVSLKPFDFKTFIYFIFISLISSFPLTYQIIREDGFRLDFILEDFNNSMPNLNAFPCDFSYAGMDCDTPFQFVFKEIVYVFDQPYEGDEKEVVIFSDSNITYIKEGNTLTSRGYQGFSDTVDLRVIAFGDQEDIVRVFQAFALGVEGSFSPYIIIYTLGTNIIVQLVVQVIFLGFLVLVLQLFKFGLSTFMTFSESLSFVVKMMTIPAILSVLVALVEPVFASVLYQFLVGIFIMIVMLKIGRKYYQ